MRSSSFVSLATLAVMATLSPHALACWGEAGQRYGVSADLLYAIARVESNLNPKAVNRSHFQRTGSYDIGLMQINNRHLSVLSRHGIRESDLLILAPTFRLVPGCCPICFPGVERHGMRLVPTTQPARNSKARLAPRPARNTPGGFTANCRPNGAANSSRHRTRSSLWPRAECLR